MIRTALGALLVGAIAVTACGSESNGSEVPGSTIVADSDSEDATQQLVTAPSTPESDGGDLVAGSPVTDENATGEKSTTSDPADSGMGVVPEGFTTVTVEVTKADGEVCEVCMWLADTSAERGRGLMGVTSLGTPAAMAFVWDEPTTGAFFMFQTVTPLSIAWFDVDGSLVSTADMNPCLADDSADCERIRSGDEYVLAIEVFQGDLESIGITDGVTARLLPGTEATDCLLI